LYSRSASAFWLNAECGSSATALRIHRAGKNRHVYPGAAGPAALTQRIVRGRLGRVGAAICLQPVRYPQYPCTSPPAGFAAVWDGNARPTGRTRRGGESSTGRGESWPRAGSLAPRCEWLQRRGRQYSLRTVPSRLLYGVCCMLHVLYHLVRMCSGGRGGTRAQLGACSAPTPWVPRGTAGACTPQHCAAQPTWQECAVAGPHQH
jgi:hypothetical protein